VDCWFVETVETQASEVGVQSVEVFVESREGAMKSDKVREPMRQEKARAPAVWESNVEGEGCGA